MYRIYKMHIKDKKYYPRIEELSTLSCNLYNKANYIWRQVFTGKLENIPEYQSVIKNNWISKFDLRKKMCELNDVDYRAFPNNHIVNNIIYNLSESYKSFFALLKKNKSSKNHQKINLPQYIKDKKKISPHIVIDGQDIKIKGDKITFPKKMNIPEFKNFLKENEVIKEIQICYNNGEFYYYIIYDDGKTNIEIKNNNKYLSIDIGVNNIMTCVDSDGNSFIVNGKKIKSINQHFNKELSKGYSYVGDKGISARINKLYHKRGNIFNNELHKMSNYIINYCKNNDIGNIIIGKNDGWKQKSDLSKKINQHFIQIPHAELINKIKYKAEAIGIKFDTVNEAYTSKCDALGLEKIEKHDQYQGKRIKRGLFKSSTGKLINADVNGALNILRCHIKNDDFIKNMDMNKLLSPYRITV